ncbi:hypothetical protein [Pseudoxanthobacter sp.]|uniref:hypothetical protein n=1 Tax=Pseudoxanthobacter sp. TaxID=1925742 RepID=UPI002FDF91EB
MNFLFQPNEIAIVPEFGIDVPGRQRVIRRPDAGCTAERARQRRNAARAGNRQTGQAPQNRKAAPAHDRPQALL